MSFRLKAISEIAEMHKIPEIDCPTRISSKTLRKTYEIARRKTGTAATGFRRKPLGKQMNAEEIGGTDSRNPGLGIRLKPLVNQRNYTKSEFEQRNWISSQNITKSTK